MSYKYELTFSIVAYKNYDQIINAVESINKYSLDYCKQIIVVDNTEKEALPNYVAQRNILKTLENVKVIENNNNLGFGKANNIALKTATGKYFVICNPDILMIEDSFSKIIPHMDKNKDIGAIVPRLVNKNGQLEPVYRRQLTLYDVIIRYIHPFGMFKKRRAYHTMQDMDYSRRFNVPFAQGSFIVIRTELMKELHGFDDRYFMYCEDADLCRKINQISRLEYFPDTSIIHLWQKGSHKNLKLLKWHIQSMIKYFNKWR